MGFTKKTWKNRIAEYINRRLITMEDGSTNLVTVARDEGTISQEGDAFNAANMNDLEDRIEAEFEEINQSLTWKNIGKFYGNVKHQMDFSKYTEYLFFINCYIVGNVNRIIEFEIPSDILTDVKGYFIGGAHQADYNTCYVTLGINNKEFSCEEFFINGTNYANEAGIVIYAK